MDAVPLEKAPKVAVYAPPNAAPWDDAVTMVLEYAGIQYDRIWDLEVIERRPGPTYDWLHLHHEDFTGQYSKFFLNYAGAVAAGDGGPQPATGPTSLASRTCRRSSRRWRSGSRRSWSSGGFLFAMCTATETLDLALASVEIDIAATYADGTPMDRDASSRMQLGPGARVPGRAWRCRPRHAGLQRHRRAPGQRARPSPATRALHAVQLHRQDRSGPDDAGAEPSPGDSGFLRPDHLVPTRYPEARGHDPGDEVGCAVGQVHPRASGGRGRGPSMAATIPEDPQHAIGDAPTDLSHCTRIRRAIG